MKDHPVEALVYRVGHSASIDYAEARPLTAEGEGFSVAVEGGLATFTFDRPVGTEGEARERVSRFIRDWEFDACLRVGPGHLLLLFERARLAPRDAVPGRVNVQVRASAGAPSVEMALTVLPDRYPSPPAGKIDSAHPDAQTLWSRYSRFREGREELPSFAYFCVTVLLSSAVSWSRKGTVRKAAAHFGISRNVLVRIRTLSSTKGGAAARKADGVDSPLTEEDEAFLRRALPRLIRRVAERAANPVGELEQITMRQLQAPP